MMNDVVNSAAIIVLSIGAMAQQRAIRRLRREHSGLRRAHHDAQRWYEMTFYGLGLRSKNPIGLNAPSEGRVDQ